MHLSVQTKVAPISFAALKKYMLPVTTVFSKLQTSWYKYDKQKRVVGWDDIHKEWNSPTTSQLQKETHLSSEQ